MLKTKTSWSKTKNKTKTFIFVLEAPRDQDLGLEDYITAKECAIWLYEGSTMQTKTAEAVIGQHQSGLVWI